MKNLFSINIYCKLYLRLVLFHNFIGKQKLWVIYCSWSIIKGFSLIGIFQAFSNFLEGGVGPPLVPTYSSHNFGLSLLVFIIP
jgi:hypothetical protein